MLLIAFQRHSVCMYGETVLFLKRFDRMPFEHFIRSAADFHRFTSITLLISILMVKMTDFIVQFSYNILLCVVIFSMVKSDFNFFFSSLFKNVLWLLESNCIDSYFSV